MTAEQFAYWMQGFAELSAGPPTAEQWQSIREHLQTVFVKVTPPLPATPHLGGIPWQPQQPLKAGSPFQNPAQATC